MDLLVTKMEERSRPTHARNRFVRVTKEQAHQYMEIQSGACLEQIASVNSFPWLYTNAGVLAEACAHWAFIARPDLRDNDDFWEE